jgi:hypothetical protein
MSNTSSLGSQSSRTSGLFESHGWVISILVPTESPITTNLKSSRQLSTLRLRANTTILSSLTVDRSFPLRRTTTEDLQIKVIGT